MRGMGNADVCCTDSTGAGRFFEGRGGCTLSLSWWSRAATRSVVGRAFPRKSFKAQPHSLHSQTTTRHNTAQHSTTQHLPAGRLHTLSYAHSTASCTDYSFH